MELTEEVYDSLKKQLNNGYTFGCHFSLVSEEDKHTFRTVSNFVEGAKFLGFEYKAAYGDTQYFGHKVYEYTQFKTRVFLKFDQMGTPIKFEVSFELSGNPSNILMKVYKMFKLKIPRDKYTGSADGIIYRYFDRMRYSGDIDNQSVLNTSQYTRMSNTPEEVEKRKEIAKKYFNKNKSISKSHQNELLKIGIPGSMDGYILSDYKRLIDTIHTIRRNGSSLKEVCELFSIAKRYHYESCILNEAVIEETVNLRKIAKIHSS